MDKGKRGTSLHGIVRKKNPIMKGRERENCSKREEALKKTKVIREKDGELL